ncbi:unnamed protein product [Chrysoparadoxa australica]
MGGMKIWVWCLLLLLSLPGISSSIDLDKLGQALQVVRVGDAGEGEQAMAKRANSVRMLLGIVDNLVQDPANEKYLAVRLMNKAFWARVGSINGGISLMTALGFELLDQGNGMGPTFVMDAQQAKEQKTQLKAVSRLLGTALEELEAGGLPPLGSTGFDPFRSSFSRKTGTDKEYQFESKLASFHQRRISMYQNYTSTSERKMVVMLPQATEIGDDLDDELDPAEEARMVMKLWQEQAADSDKVVAFESRASKQAKAVVRSKLYPYVLIRVRFPDGLYIQGRFNPRESLHTVYEAVKDCLAYEGDKNISFFTSPPKRDIEDAETSLWDRGLRPPAHLVHASWRGPTIRSSEAVKSELMAKAVPFERKWDFPAASSGTE